MTLETIRNGVSALYEELGAHGLILGSSGNVSGRTRDGMAITPSGGSPPLRTPTDVAVMDLDGGVANQATPSSEWPMHAAIYRAFPDARFIVHAHCDACTALACLAECLPAFHYMVVQFGGEDVRCAPYVTFGTPALAEIAVTALAGRTACLLANHGMIVLGRTQQEALAHSLLLEQLCRQYLLARAAGTPRLLTTEEMAAAKDRFRTYGPRAKAAG
ncbi:MAG: class II aldolase/adducin family protein [Acetobacteraceae bacterium]|nr:class II aldolase/adducin family protein [Acetobacteraceae bacterium]